MHRKVHCASFHMNGVREAVGSYFAMECQRWNFLAIKMILHDWYNRQTF